MNRIQTLDASRDAVMRDREATHGKPEDSFGLIAKFWSGYLGVEVKDYQVAEMMVLLKVARSKFKPFNEDHNTDQAGYAACANELKEKHMAKESFWSRPLNMSAVEPTKPINSPSPLPSSALHEAYSSVGTSCKP